MDHVPKSTRLSLRFSLAGSKVIRGIIARRRESLGINLRIALDFDNYNGCDNLCLHDTGCNWNVMLMVGAFKIMLLYSRDWIQQEHAADGGFVVALLF